MTTAYGDMANVYMTFTVPYGQTCNTTMAVCIAGDMTNPDTGPIGINYYP